EKRQVQREDTAADDEEQDERERDQGKENCAGAEADEQRRQELATTGGCHAAASASTGSAVTVSVRAMLQISRRENELMIRVMMNSTSPISTSADRYSLSAASANSLATTAAIVYCGAKSDSDTFGLFPITIVTAIVSPSARPKPSMTAPMMPVRAKNMAARIASNGVAPSA